MQIQDKGVNIGEAFKGQNVAVSIKGNIMVGRHIKEGDILYVNVPEEHVSVLLREFKDSLSEDEIILLKELSQIRRGRRIQHA